MPLGRTGLLTLTAIAALFLPTTVAVAAPAPQPVSNLAVQPAGGTIAEVQQRLFFSGEGPASYTTELAGRYAVGVTATYNPNNDISGTGECFFFGHIAGVQNAAYVNLTDAGQVNSIVDYFYNPVVNFAAGEYVLDVVQPTNCSWSVEFLPGQAVAPSLNIVSAGVYVLRAGKLTPVTELPYGQRFYLFVSYNATGTAKLYGRVTLQNGAGPPGTYDLTGIKGATRAYFTAIYSPKKNLSGHVRATFTLTAGSLRATETIHFILVNPLSTPSG